MESVAPAKFKSTVGVSSLQEMMEIVLSTSEMSQLKLSNLPQKYLIHEQMVRKEYF